MNSQNATSSANSLDASVIIVSFNTCALLRECIQTLKREAAGLAYETIVVDNASHDGSADMVAAEFPEVRLIRSTANLGFGGANNRGFEVARGRYIVLLNSDAFPRPRALQLSVEHMDRNPDAGLGGGKLVGRDDSWQPSARMFPSPINDLLTMAGIAAKYPRSRWFGRADRTWADASIPASVDWITGAYAIVRRSVLERVGFFDERFFLYYEEVDLCRRIKSAQNQIWYWPDIVTVHLGGESAKTIKTQKVSSAGSQLTLWRIRSEFLYYRKHHGALGAWSVMLLEAWWNRIRALRNSLARSDERRAKSEESRQMAATVSRAWAETRGGTVCPPRPW
jgi:GT2 family glycosyltransferase